MNANSPRRQFIWLALLFLALPIMARAQDPTQPTPAPPADPLAGIPVQVLDQQAIDAGDHQIVLNRIAPPNLPTPVPTPPPVVQPVPPSNTAPAPEKPLKVVSLSIDSKNQLLTEVHGYNGAKPSCMHS